MTCDLLDFKLGFFVELLLKLRFEVLDVLCLEFVEIDFLLDVFFDLIELFAFGEVDVINFFLLGCFDLEVRLQFCTGLSFAFHQIPL